MSNEDFFKVDGEIDETGACDAGGGDFEVIPNNSQVLATIVESKYSTFKEFGASETDPGYEGINNKWQILAPEELKGRVVFQKLHTGHSNPDKATKSKRMLIAIDINAGGKLRAKGVKPTDQDLMTLLTNKPMMITVRTWGKAGQKQGNWVGAVAKKGSAEIKVAEAPKQSSNIDDDDLAF